jgi:hypothetical protein
MVLLLTSWYGSLKPKRLQWYYSGVGVALECNSVLQCVTGCYSGVTVVLQWCYSVAPDLLVWVPQTEALAQKLLRVPFLRRVQGGHRHESFGEER